MITTWKTSRDNTINVPTDIFCKIATDNTYSIDIPIKFSNG